MINPEQIPDAVVEAAAKALYETWCAVNEVADTSLPWDDIYDGERNACIAEARATIATALSMWPGALHSPDEVIDGELLPPIISLPLLQKERSDG